MNIEIAISATTPREALEQLFIIYNLLNSARVSVSESREGDGFKWVARMELANPDMEQEPK